MYTGSHRGYSLAGHESWSRAATATRAGRCALPLARSYRDPHDVLGLAHDADDKQVKKAFKKLALKLHPDVNQEELAEAKFLALKEAYELLLGKGDPDRAKNAPFGGNWEFHDWYWSFSMRQRQRRQSSSAPGHSSAAAQQHRPKVSSQLLHLKSRARRRQATGEAAGEAFASDSGTRRPARHTSPSVEAPHHAMTQPPPTPAHCSRTRQRPRHSDPGTHAAHRYSQQSTASSVPLSPHFDPLNLFSSGQAHAPSTAPASVPSTLEEEVHRLQVMHSQAHAEYFPAYQRHSHSPLDVGFWGSIAQHFPPPRAGFLEATIQRHNVCMQSATAHVVELVAGVGNHMHVGYSQHFTGGISQPRQGDAGPDGGRDEAGSAPPHLHSDVAAAAEASQRVANSAVASADSSVSGQEEVGHAEPPSHEESEAAYSPPRFVATEGRRSAVRSQLAGLRRKARLHAR